MKNQIIYLLFLITPNITCPMDWFKSSLSSTANLLGAASNYSPGSPSSLPTSQLPTSQPTQNNQLLPLTQTTVQDQNNNNTQELTDPSCIMKTLRKNLFADVMNASEDDTISILSSDMQKAVITFKTNIQKYAPRLKGPDFYALQNHIFELENALKPAGASLHQSSLQDLEKTIDLYLNDPLHQQETLMHSFYMSPKENLIYPFSHYYIDFFAATRAYLKTLESQDSFPRALHLLETCNTLQELAKKLKDEKHPNVVLAGNSKLTTFATLCLQNNQWFEQQQGCYCFEKQAVQQMLSQWAALTPQHVGIEAAWGFRYLEKNTKDNLYQEDRGAFFTSPDFDCFALFDGHGGSKTSQYCSEHLIKTIIQQEGFTNALLYENVTDMYSCIDNAFKQCNNYLDLNFWNVDGSTALLLFIPHNAHHGFTIQLGDSEGYTINDHECTSITPVLHNTKNPAEVDYIRKAHGEDAITILGHFGSTPTLRVGGALLVTRALGNLPRIRKLLNISPTITKFPLKKGSVCLLGTDGVFENNDITTIASCARYKQNTSAGEIATYIMTKIKPYSGDNKMLMVIKLDPYVSKG